MGNFVWWVDGIIVLCYNSGMGKGKIKNHPPGERRVKNKRRFKMKFKKNVSLFSGNVKCKISRVEPTGERLSARGGLAWVVRYIEQIGIYELLERYFGKLKRTSKGLSPLSIIKQILCFFIDGTAFSLVRFDELREDPGYAGVIEEPELVSSHTVKRFFRKFNIFLLRNFRFIFHRLFIWRLRIERPSFIVLGVDTIPLDNSGAKKREGVSYTYKGFYGFQPLVVSWNGLPVDAIFRGGSRHCNYGDTVKSMIHGLVRLIRKYYDPKVSVLVRMDAGFFDGSNFLCMWWQA